MDGPVFAAFMALADSCRALYFPDEEAWYRSFPGPKSRKLEDGLMEEGGGIGFVNAMIKREVSDYPKKGRLIQMVRGVGTQCETGPQISALQKAVKVLLRDYVVSPGISVTFACGMTPGELTEWGNGSGLTYFECDGKSWDATQAKNHQDFKFAFYDRVDSTITPKLTAHCGRDETGAEVPGMYTIGKKVTCR